MARKSTSKKRHTAVPPTETLQAAAKKKSKANAAKLTEAVASAPVSATPIKHEAAIAAVETTTVAVATIEAPVIETPVMEAVIAKAPIAEPIATIEANKIEAKTPQIEATEEVKTEAAAGNTAALVAALHDSSADIARDAAVALGEAGDRSAVEPLIDVVYNTDGYFHGVVRAAAVASLGQFRDASAVPAILFALDDNMAETSAEAARALAKIGDASTVSPLIQIVQNVNGFYLATVRRAAVIALGQLGGEAAKAALQFVADDQFEDAVIRDAAQRAL